MDNKQALSSEEVNETRIALAFFGGVALAIYESGVAVEFFRLVNGEGVYGALKQKSRSGDVSVDIITGTSAGGLNGALLANAIVNRGDISKLLTLWREEGDIDKLLYGPFKSSPESLLDGDRFKNKIFEALIAKRAAPPSESALQPAIDLFLTATNLDGDRVVVTTPDHEEIPTRTHRQVFHFRYRKKEPGQDAIEINDFRTEEDLCLLAQAARASASFPLAFTPVLVKKSSLGSRALHLEADAYHIDGGVLDNKPIELALQAIAKRRANKKIRRLLFYIEPDPEKIHSRTCQDAPRSYSAPEVVLKALVDLPAYQSITTALQNIERRNQNVSDLRRTLEYYESVAAKYKESKAGVHEGAFSDLRYIEPTDAPTALFRAQEDGYLDLRLRRELTEDFFKLLMEVTGQARDLLSILSPQDQDAVSSVKNEIYRFKSLLLRAIDLKYHRRLYKYLIQIVRQLYPEPLKGTGGGTGDEWSYISETTRRLNLLKEMLYDQDELIAQLELSQAAALKSELVAIKAQLLEILEKTKSASTSKDLVAHFIDLSDRIVATDFFRRRLEFIQGVHSTVLQRLENEHSELQKQWESKASDVPGTRPFCQRIMEGYWALRDALDSFYLRDIIIYPMMPGDELASELEYIHFSRISPADANHFIPGLSTEDKIAGEKFFHFGGFLNKEWRGNDLTWGRLDTAEIIIRKLISDGPEQKRLIEEAHREIIEEMNSLDMGIYGVRSPSAAQMGPPRRDDLIGRQQLSAIPPEKKISWAWRGAITLLKIVRQTLAKTKASFLLKSLFEVLDRLILFMTGALVLFTWCFAKFLRVRILIWLIAAAAFIGLGAVLLLAWKNPLGKLWDGLLLRIADIF
ncbi:patatin-like protein [Crenobacter cavernae]|nr:patatin-like protein [Crenobacter cavernae]